MEAHQNPFATGASQTPQVGAAPARAPIPVLKLKLGSMTATVGSGTSSSAPQPTITVKPVAPPVNIPPPIPHNRPAPINIPAPVPHISKPQAPPPVPTPAPAKVLPPLVVKTAGLKLTIPKPAGPPPAAPTTHVSTYTPPPASPIPVLHISSSSTPTPPPHRPMIPSAGTTVGQAMGISPAGGSLKLSSKFVFKVAKPSTETGVAAPVVVAVQQRERLFIRLPRHVVKQELENIRRRANLKKAKAKARREAAGDDHIDVDGDSDHAMPPAKRSKPNVSADSAAASTAIEGYTPPPEDAQLVPFEGVPNYVPNPDPLKKYIPLKKVLGSTLKQLISLDRGGFFYDPVTEQVAPGYFEIVKRPMDFVTMRRKIDESRYPFFSLFQYDFEQIIKNCFDYNDEDSLYVEQAQILLRQGREVMAANRLKVQPRQLEAPPAVLQQALEEDERIRQRDLANAANPSNATGAASAGDDMDVDEEPQAGRASRAQSQRALAVEEAEEEREMEPQLIRTFPPRRHYVDLPPQPLRPVAASASTGPVLVTVNATNLPVGAVLPPGLLGRGSAAGRPSVGAVVGGLQNRAVSLIGPDGKPIITPFNRFQTESAKLLQLVQYRFEASPAAFEEYSKSINRFIGEGEGWAPEALAMKVQDLLASISDNQLASPQLWSTSTRMFPKRVPLKPQSRPQATTKVVTSIPQDLQEQLERIELDKSQLGIHTLEISDEDKSLLSSLQDEIDSELWETLRHVVVAKDPEPKEEPMSEDHIISVS